MAMLSILNGEVPECLTKRYSLKDGKLQKQTCGQMAVGFCEIAEVNDIHEMSKLLQSLKNNQALCYGVPKTGKVGDKIKIVPDADKKTGEISRTTKDFKWNSGAGVMFLDHDSGLDKDEFISTVTEAMPSLLTVNKLWMPSSSSFIYNGKKRLTGLRGQRLYFFVDDASKIQTIGETLYKRMWLSGFGHIQISAAGSLLERSAVDASVWQCNRLDFASGAKCDAPLTQINREPIALVGCWERLEFAKVELLTDKEDFDYKKLVIEAKNELRPEADKQQSKHIEKRLEKVPVKKRNELRKFYQAAYKGGDLAGDFNIVLFKDGKQIEKTVTEILADRKTYDKCKTLDPIEPEYNNYHKTGILFLDDRGSMLNSKAHGEINYKLTEKIIKTREQNIIDEMSLDLDNQESGKVFDLRMPWTRLTDTACALRPGSVTIVSGPTKAGKSFFMQNIIQYNHERGVDWAYMPLEDGTAEWLWRMLAIIKGDFTMKHRDKTTAKQRKEVFSQNIDLLKEYISNLTDNPRSESVVVNGRKTKKGVRPEFVLDWIIEQVRKKKRLIVADPLAMIDFKGRNKWEVEDDFMKEAVGIVADTDSSLMLVSHTQKGSGGDTPLTVENLQGPAAYGRISHTVLLVESLEEQEVNIKKAGGVIEAVTANRIVTIATARNGSGSRSRLAFYFDKDAPRFKELGFMAMKRKGR